MEPLNSLAFAKNRYRTFAICENAVDASRQPRSISDAPAGFCRLRRACAGVPRCWNAIASESGPRELRTPGNRRSVSAYVKADPHCGRVMARRRSVTLAASQLGFVPGSLSAVLGNNERIDLFIPAAVAEPLAFGLCAWTAARGTPTVRHRGRRFGGVCGRGKSDQSRSNQNCQRLCRIAHRSSPRANTMRLAADAAPTRLAESYQPVAVAAMSA